VIDQWLNQYDFIMINKSIANLSIILGLCIFLSACDKSAEQSIDTQNSRIKIAILSTSDFFPDRAVQQQMGLPKQLASRVIERLTISKRFQVLERTALRKIINEQQFGKENKESFLDKSLNAAIDNIADTDGLTVAVTTSAADHNDLIKEYQNLGSTMGADYLVFAVLEKSRATSKKIALPYSESNKSFTKNKIDARLRLRIINAKTGNIAGAASFRTQLSESLLTGQESKRDEYSIFDHLANLASNKILDITFPATIVSADPFVINRGKNDNYSVDSTFKVLRAGKEITDASGVVIGRLNSPTGTIKLIDLQETLSVVEVVDGNIQQGDILEIAEVAKGTVKKAPRTTHENGKQNGKITLAVGKIRLNTLGNHTIFATRYRTRVSNDLLVKLTNSNRFDVLERQEIDQIFDEKSFAALSSGQEIDGKLTELIEADYLVFTSVNDFYIKTERKQVAYVDEIQTQNFGVVDATLRIVDSHTGKLLAADKIRINKKIPSTSNNETDTVWGDLIDGFSSSLVSNIMQRLYPIRIIAAISESDFYINRGLDGGLSKGTVFDIMREGEEMFDPDTGISFGKVEQKIAQVSVADIEASRSKVHLISGTEVKTGDILRLAKKEIKAAPTPQVRKPNF